VDCNRATVASLFVEMWLINDDLFRTCPLAAEELLRIRALAARGDIDNGVMIPAF